MANGTRRFGILKLFLILNGFMLYFQAVTADLVSEVPAEQLPAEARAQKQEQDVLIVEEDLDGRSAYINNQFVPSEPIELVDDIRNAPLYEILQKQMEQVLAASGPDVPIFEDDKSKRQRLQHLPNNKPQFSSYNEADTDEEYVDLLSETAPSYTAEEKPDAGDAEQEQLNSNGYQTPQLTTSSVSKLPSTRPQRRRTTTAIPRVTRVKTTTSTTKMPNSLNQTELASTVTVPTNQTSHRPRPSQRPANHSNNSLPHEPQIYQHKRRIIFKTISTGSQFVNSPIGDLMIKFSIGYAKPAQSAASSTSETLRMLSNNIIRNLELQKLKRYRLQKK